MSIIYPKVTKDKNRRTFYKTKSAFNIHEPTKDIWVPQTDKNNYLFNQSSVNYNIINHEKNPFFTKCHPMKNYSKNNVMSNFFDLDRPFHLHKNKQYNDALNNYSYIFRKIKGIFTHMYDDSTRNGKIYLPFETKKTREGEMNSNKN